jgi:hypothetical protein
MSIIVKEPDQKDWERPEDGTYVGVIADVIDLGEVQTGFGVKPKVQIMWLLDAFDSDGHQHRVSSFYTASLHEKANLRKALKSILGADVSGQFDLEELLGINNQLVLQTTESGEKTYTNVIAILKAPKGPRMEIPDDFVRKSEKEDTKKQVKKAAPQLKKVAAPVQTAVQDAVVEEQAQAQAQEPTPAPIAPTAAPTAATPRAGTIRQARTVTPAPTRAAVVAPVAKKAVNPAIAAARAALAAAEAAENTAASDGPITNQDIPF